MARNYEDSIIQMRSTAWDLSKRCVHKSKKPISLPAFLLHFRCRNFPSLKSQRHASCTSTGKIQRGGMKQGAYRIWKQKPTLGYLEKTLLLVIFNFYAQFFNFYWINLEMIELLLDLLALLTRKTTACINRHETFQDSNYYFIFFKFFHVPR